MLPRSNSVRSLKGAFEAVQQQAVATSESDTKAFLCRLPRSESTKSMRPLPPLPRDDASVKADPGQTLLSGAACSKTPLSTGPKGSLASRLPKFAGLRSILRPSRAEEQKITAVSHDLYRASGTPKLKDATATGSGSAKKVDFTPSTKSRYAVKLASATPSPSKLPRAGHSSVGSISSVPYDPAAYLMNDTEEDESCEDAESEIRYPTIPSSQSEPAVSHPMVVNTFSQKAKEHNRRESKEFKSIFTTLEHPSRPSSSSSLTQVNTLVNKSNPVIHANVITKSPSNTDASKLSASTIRHVRTSGVEGIIQPFEDEIEVVPHGLPGKKRRRESAVDRDPNGADNDAKENRRISVMPQVPGGWEDTVLDEDEGEKRGGKRVRMVDRSEDPNQQKIEPKKHNAAREAAVKNAKERKGKGILSLSRLNVLARPKARK